MWLGCGRICAPDALADEPPATSAPGWIKRSALVRHVGVEGHAATDATDTDARLDNLPGVDAHRVNEIKPPRVIFLFPGRRRRHWDSVRDPRQWPRDHLIAVRLTGYAPSGLTPAMGAQSLCPGGHRATKSDPLPQPPDQLLSTHSIHTVAVVPAPVRAARRLVMLATSASAIRTAVARPR